MMLRNANVNGKSREGKGGEELGKIGEEKKETIFDFKGCAAASRPQLKTIIAK